MALCPEPRCPHLRPCPDHEGRRGNRPQRTWMSLRAQVLTRDGYRCVACGYAPWPWYLSEAGTMRVDHIVPRVAGGSDTLDNLQTLCRVCHAAKTKAER